MTEVLQPERLYECSKCGSRMVLHVPPHGEVWLACSTCDHKEQP